MATEQGIDGGRGDHFGRLQRSGGRTLEGWREDRGSLVDGAGLSQWRTSVRAIFCGSLSCAAGTEKVQRRLEK